MWKWLLLISAVGFAAYSYLAKPMWVELGMADLTCRVQGGVYLRSTELSPQYWRMMSGDPENASRLSSGDAKGCFDDGVCVYDRREAVSLLEKKMLGWSAVGGGNLLKGNVMKMLGLSDEQLARARQAEAQFCVDYLGETRRELLRGLEKAQPVAQP